MSNRNFGYYGNQRLQQQTYSRNLYLNNVNGKKIITNPQNSNGDASQFETYHEGSQTTYSRGLIGAGEAVSVGGIFGIPVIVPPVPCTPTIIDISSIATYNGFFWVLNSNTTIPTCSVLNITFGTTLVIPFPLTLTNDGTINNNGQLTRDSGSTFTNNGTFNNIYIYFADQAGTTNNNSIFNNVTGAIVFNNDGNFNNNGTFNNDGQISNSANFGTSTFNNDGIIYNKGTINNFKDPTAPTAIINNNNIIYNTSIINNDSVFNNNGTIYTGSAVCGIGIISGSVPITGTGTITPGCP